MRSRRWCSFAHWDRLYWPSSSCTIPRLPFTDADINAVQPRTLAASRPGIQLVHVISLSVKPLAQFP